MTVRVLIFELLDPSPPVPLPSPRVPGEALAALREPLLLRRVELTPPDTETVERILDALREW